ncbi:MAG: hypothetical protein IPL53_12155 [Ignavibacteria bacterium]|nr:hypothetical protein [Ignavibacteria bacterium]
MKKVFKSILVVLSLVLFFNFFTVNQSVAGNSASLEMSSAKADLFIYVRVQEGERSFIYIYTGNGIYITKISDM